MSQISYFKRQAKNLHKDYKIQAPYIDALLLDYRFEKSDFCLMKAQHIIALRSGFGKWTDLMKASAVELELAKLLFDNQDKIPVEHWKKYISAIGRDNGIILDAETKLEIFKHDYEVTFGSLVKNESVIDNKQERKVPIPDGDKQITSLPLSMDDRSEFIEIANSVFKTVLLRMMPRNPGLVRKLWNAEGYVDNMLTEDMLPISRDYAASLIDTFLVHHVAGLITQVDKIAGSPDKLTVKVETGG